MTREETIEFGNRWLEVNEDSKNSRTYEFFQIVIKLLDQEPFINKDCVSKSACHEDKIRVLDKITTEMEQLTVAVDTNCNQYVSKNDVINIINKYKTERNDKE